MSTKGSVQPKRGETKNSLFVLSTFIAFSETASALANADANKDGKVSTGEILGTVFSVTPALLSAVTGAKAAAQLWAKGGKNGLSFSEKNFVLNSWAEKFDLENDEPEEKVEAVVLSLNDIEKAARRLYAAFDNNPETVFVEEQDEPDAPDMDGLEIGV